MFVKPHFMYVLIIVIYVLVVIIQAVKNKREGAGLFFIAYLIFSLCAINDILNIFEVYSTQSMVSPGLVIFVFLLSVLQGKKMINMNHRNNVLSSNLKMLNKELENKVSNRTLELKESLQKLQELDSYKENMTHMLVHDLKTPLNSIVNCNILPDSERTEVIQQSGSQLLNLVQNMLDVYKSEKAELPLNITSFLFSELISGAVGEISVSLKVRELSVNFNQVVDYKLMADRILMHRVVVNILINATKFAPAKSVIRINSKLNREGVLRVGIYNSGPSISKKDQLEIFNLFKQTKHGIKNAGSTGLGLAFCKLAIVAHKGNIGVESNGVGAEFWFSISSVNALDSVGDKSIVVFDGEFALTSDDKCLLKAISEQLVGVELYNITQIKKVLHGFENKNKAISNWLSKVEEAAYSGDVVSYNNLIKLPYT